MSSAMDRHLLYLINPISGSRTKSGLQDLIETKTRAAGLKYTIQHSVANANYSHLHPFIEGEKVTDIVIAGGDGTVNGALNHFQNFDLSFGIIPCGSGNGLAFGAGIPKQWDGALDVIFRGNAMSTDAFLINGSFACMLCGLGFDAHVAHQFANDPSRGLSTYIKKTLAHFFTAKAYPFTIRSGEEELQTEALFISIANSNQFGNHFTIAPHASLKDGLLDIVIVAKQTKLSMLLQTIRQVRGFNQLHTAKIGNSKAAVLYFQTEALHIENPASAPLHIDGDPAPTAATFEIKILKDCFRLIYP